MAGTLEAALATLLREPAKITGAGRTDSGVHATGQVVSFSTRNDFPVERLAVALNALLPPDCSVRDAARMENDFSARFSAIERTYEYAILNRPQRSALTSRYACHVARPLDADALRDAGARLLGEHDFRSFASAARPSDAISAILAGRDRTAAGPTAPAAGLCLAGVRYRNGYDSYAPHPLWQANSLAP